MRFSLVTLLSTPSCFTRDRTDYRSLLMRSSGISHLASGILLRRISKTPLFDAFDSSIALITLLLHFFSLFQTLNNLKWLNGWFVISWKPFVMLNYLSAKIIHVHWLVHVLFRIPRVFFALSTLLVQSCKVAYFESCACSWKMHHPWTSNENEMFSFDLFWTCLEVVSGLWSTRHIADRGKKSFTSCIAEGETSDDWSFSIGILCESEWNTFDRSSGTACISDFDLVLDCFNEIQNSILRRKFRLKHKLMRREYPTFFCVCSYLFVETFPDDFTERCSDWV